MKNFKTIAAMLLLSISSNMTFTSCQDDTIDNGKSAQPAPEGAQKALLEAYGLTFENFVTSNDVQILNADTTEISVNKALAEKLSITSFVNHPMGIWDAKNHLPYARKATAERLSGDRYILTVQPATVAEILGNKKVTLNTSIYVNQNVTNNQTRAGIAMPSYAARFIDDNDVIHPAVILCTDPYGYDKTYHDSDAKPKSGTRAASDFQYYDAETLASEGSRASVCRNILSIHEDLKFNKELKSGGSTATFDFKAPTDFELNYFLTIDGGVKWNVIIPCPYVKSFETGLDGSFSFKPELNLTFENKMELPKDKSKFDLISFNGYTFTFWIGPVPICISCNPNLYLRLDGSIESEAHMGIKYEYENSFRGGVHYDADGGWGLIREFTEKKNELTPTWPEGKFSATAGIGLYLGVEVLLYNCTGPKVAVGPQLSAKAEGEFKADLDGIDADFKASVDMAAKAEAGVKLKVLGYELADWSESFDIVGPWNLFKYPSDGNEHKSPLVQQQDYMRKLLEKGSRECKEAMSELIDIKAQMGGKSYKDAENELLSELNKLTESINNDKDKLVKAYDYIIMGRNSIQQQYEQWRIDKNWKDICQFLMENEKAKIEAAKDDNYFWTGRAFNWTHERFVKKFGREPRQTEEDLQWLINQISGYRDVAFFEALDQAMKFPEVEKAKRMNADSFQKAVDNIHEVAIKKYGEKSTADANYVELVRRYIVIYFQRTYGSRYTNFK